MNLEKLERISCLKIDEKNRADLLSSLEDVFSMMESIQELSTSKINAQKIDVTTFLNVESEFIIKESEQNSVNLDDGFFLAPKVIKKD